MYSIAINEVLDEESIGYIARKGFAVYVQGSSED